MKNPRLSSLHFEFTERGILATIAVLLIALIIFVIAPNWERLNRLAERGVLTTGELVEARSTVSSPSVVFEISFRYRVAGRTYDVTEGRRAFPPAFSNLHRGDTITIFYLPEEPAVAVAYPLPDEVCRKHRQASACRPEAAEARR